MAKRQAPRPTVRISRDAPDAVPAPRAPARKALGSTPPPAPARRPVRRPPVEHGPTQATDRRPAPTVAPVPVTIPAVPNYRGHSGAVSPSGVTPTRTAVAAAPDSGMHVPHAATSRAAAARAREAGQRLFGDYSYVKRDLRRVAVLTAGALVLLIALSFLLPLWLK